MIQPRRSYVRLRISIDRRRVTIDARILNIIWTCIKIVTMNKRGRIASCSTWNYMTRGMSFLFGKFTFLPCHRLLCIVKASIVTVKCFVCTCEKRFPPELYLEKKTHFDVIFSPTFHNRASNSLKKFVKHFVRDLLGSCTVQFRDFFPVGAVRVESTKLKAHVPKQNEEMFGFGARDFVQNTLLRFPVDDSREDAVLHRVQHYASIRLCRWLFVQSWTWNGIRCD